MNVRYNKACAYSICFVILIFLYAIIYIYFLAFNRNNIIIFAKAVYERNFYEKDGDKMSNKSILKRIVTLILSVLLLLTISSVSTYTVLAAEVTLADNTRDGLQAAIEEAGNRPTTINISQGFSFDGNAVVIPNGANVTIRSQGNTSCILTQTGNRHFNVIGGLTLEDIILDGNYNGTNTITSGGVDVNVDGIYHGVLTMNGGAVIQNCYTKSGGAGVSVTYGTFTMNGDAVIQNCTADSGGGLLIISSIATIHNGTIKGSKATCGGGIYITGSNSTFTMYDGMIGGDNAADGNAAGYGGGIFAVGTNNKIYIGGNATGPADGGNPKINGNTAYFYGGGVSLGGNDRYTMYRGEINGNKNTESGIYGVGGAGIHIRAGSYFSVLGGTINDNTTVKNGGGIFVNGGNFTMGGTSVVSGNTAALNGGGIYGNVGYTDARATVTLNSGVISGNKGTYGGGVFLDKSDIVMGVAGGGNDSVSVENNTAGYMGGGVDAHNGSTFTMHCGTINGNHSVSGGELTYGGGVAVYNNSTFTMKNGMITGNSATDYSGGVEIYQNSLVTMDGGSITNNSASRGGGIGVGYQSAGFIMNGGIIQGNTASFSGGGVYAYATGSVTVASGTVTGNSSLYGGGIFVLDTGKIDVNNCLITNNAAIDDGGGIYTADRSYANLTTGSGTYFESNTAATPYVPGGNLNIMYPGIRYGAVTAPYTHPLNNYDINTRFGAPFNCHITFDSQGGSGVPDQIKDFGEKVDEPANPVKTGYTFLGWWIINENGDWDYEWDFDTILDEDIHGTEIVLHAKWDAQLVTVTGTVRGLPDNSGIEIYYSTDGGMATNTITTDADGVYSISVLYDLNLIITPSAQEGYGVKPANRNITVTADNLTGNDFTYTFNEYTVTFDSNGGNSVDSQTVSYGETAAQPADPVKAGHAFAGWYTDNDTFENQWDFDADTVTNDITLYAQWTEMSEPMEPSDSSEQKPSPTPIGPGNPKTGGDHGIALWSILFFSSFTAMLLFGIKQTEKEMKD